MQHGLNQTVSPTYILLQEFMLSSKFMLSVSPLSLHRSIDTLED